MANFFSADYWKALYFKAIGGQETATDPNAMAGSFAGSASFTGTLDLPAGAISGSFVGTSAFTGVLDTPAQYPSQDFRNVLDGPGEDYWLRKKKLEKARKKQLDDERLAALEIELAQIEAELASTKKLNPLEAVVQRLTRRPARKQPHPVITEPTELMKAKADAEAEAVAQQAMEEEEVLLLLLLAA